MPPEGAGSGAGFEELAAGVGEEDVVVARVGVVVCAGWVVRAPVDCTDASSLDAVVVDACCTGWV